MTPTMHEPEAEMIMAYLDGELAGHEAERIRLHLHECAACAGVAAGFRRTSEAIATWDVGAAPFFAPKIRDMRSSSAWWRRLPRRYAMAAAAAVLVVAVGLSVWQPSKRAPAMGIQVDAPMMVEMGGAAADGTTSNRAVAGRSVAGASVVAEMVKQEARERSGGPVLIRTGRIAVATADFGAARARLDEIVRQSEGFLGQVDIAGSSRDQRSLSATVRVPTTRFDGTLAALRGLGRITAESQNTEDVTQQSVDLDARLSNARASEARLRAILDQRTGKLSDVLDVEREISRVRGEIERMDAERKDLDRRITYAAIQVTISEEKKAAIDLGPQPLSERFRNAFVVGWRDAIGGMVEAGLVLTGLVPTLILIAVAGAPVVWWLRRRRPA